MQRVHQRAWNPKPYRKWAVVEIRLTLYSQSPPPSPPEQPAESTVQADVAVEGGGSSGHESLLWTTHLGPHADVGQHHEASGRTGSLEVCLDAEAVCRKQRGVQEVKSPYAA